MGRKPPGFAFIEFEDRRDADDAIRALNGIYTSLNFLDLLHVYNDLMIGSKQYFMDVAFSSTMVNQILGYWVIVSLVYMKIFMTLLLREV